MHRKQQHMLLITEPQELRAKQRPTCEIKGSACRICRDPFNLCRLFLIIERAQVGNGKRVSERCNSLCRTAVQRVKSSAQGFVPPHNLLKCLLERCYIEWAMQTNAGEEVISRAFRLHPVQEPETFLREG